MRPTIFTTEDVITAGQELLESGRNISGFALRQCIGSGTPALLKQAWDDYIASKLIEKVEHPSVELPSQIATSLAKITTAQTEQLTRLVKEINAVAVKSADSRVEVLITEQAIKDKQTEEELAEALAAYENLEAKLDDEIAKNAALDQQLAQAAGDIMQGREAAAKLIGQLEAITAENTKLLAMLQPKK